jgi:hypothetical protein
MTLPTSTLSWLLQTATGTRDAFAWLGTIADGLAILSAIVAVIAWSRARKAATEAQEAVKGLRTRQRRMDAHSAAVDLSSLLRDLKTAQNARQWPAALKHYERVRPLLVQIRSGEIRLLSDVQEIKLSVAAAEFTSITSAIADALQQGDEALANLDTGRYNDFVDGIADIVEEAKITLREGV